MRTIRLLVLALSLVVFSAACGSDGDSSAEIVDDAGDTSSDDTSTSDDAPATLFSSLDFEPVCRGIGIEAATAYAADGGVNPIVGLSGEDPSYDSIYSVGLAEGWEPEFEALDTTELVVCLNRTATVDGELCEGFEDEDSGLAWSVMTFGGTYEVALRDAFSGEVVAETTLDTEADSCPMFSSYTEGDPTPVPDYTTPDDALQAWLAEYVTARAANRQLRRGG